MQFLRYLLLPFSVLYGCVTWLRNKFFDWGIKKVYNIPFPSIGVGNLSVGGTGKTPHVLLFKNWLAEVNNVTIISRGYGRKTNGLIIANNEATAETIGDEPLLFLNSSPQPMVIVAEKRREAIDLLKKKKEETIVLLDDVFQHRHVKPGFNVLLCDFHSPYFKDFMLPTGNLREFKSGEKRADVVVVTKCPYGMTETDKDFFRRNIDHADQNIFFSEIKYFNLESFSNISVNYEVKNAVLVTGIANPKPLEEHLSKDFSLKSVIFPDHHAFTEADIHRIHEIFNNFASENSVILTTEKDAMRLEKFKLKGILKNYPWCVQKMDVQIDREEELKAKVKAYVREVQ